MGKTGKWSCCPPGNRWHASRGQNRTLHQISTDNSTVTRTQVQRGRSVRGMNPAFENRFSPLSSSPSPENTVTIRQRSTSQADAKSDLMFWAGLEKCQDLVPSLKSRSGGSSGGGLWGLRQQLKRPNSRIRGTNTSTSVGSSETHKVSNFGRGPDTVTRSPGKSHEASRASPWWLMQVRQEARSNPLGNR